LHGQVGRVLTFKDTIDIARWGFSGQGPINPKADVDDARQM
jgi:hypothetical protein